MARRSFADLRREPGWVGREERTEVRLDGYARRAGDSVVHVTIHDLSRDGCRLDSPDTLLTIGEWLELDVAGLQSFRAQVRWALFGSAGVQFQD